MNNKVMVLDGNSILNRAFYGLQGPTLLSTRDGLYTNAVYGFLNILFKHMEEEKSDYICVAFDLKAPTFRHKEYAGYKAGRAQMPEELAVQVPIIKQILDAMNIKRFELEGYEADDIIGAVSLIAEKSGLECIIVTGDKDALQLVSDGTYVKIVSTVNGASGTKKYDCNAVTERYGVTPGRLIDIKGLMGDPSDNIPGVPGIGEKTAIELIKNFGSIENLYNSLGAVENKRNIIEKLKQNEDLAVLSKRLSTIQRELPMEIDIKDMQTKPYDTNALYEIFKKLEFKSIIQKLGLKPDVYMQKYNFDCIKSITAMDELVEIRSKIMHAGTFSMHFVMNGELQFKRELEAISIALNENEAFYIIPEGELTCDNIVSVLKPILESCNIKKIGHDFKPVCVYLKNRGVNLQGIYMDTMIGAYLIDPAKDNYRIETVMREFLNIDISCDESSKQQILQGIAAIIFKLSGVISDEIKQNQQQYLLDNIEIPLIYVLADMEHIGFKVDVQELNKIGTEIDKRIECLVNSIYMLAGEEFNINSTKQLGVVLFEKLGLPPIKKTKTGYSTDVEVLEKLCGKHDIVSYIIEYRQLMKLKTTYIEGLINVVNPETGRIHSSFNQTVTATGRISSTEPNLQNVPIKLDMGRQIRRAFVPSSTEHVLMDADYSQIELRVLAHITGDTGLVEAFENGEDIHTVTASQVFGVPIQDVTGYMRSRAKTVNFGIIYGIGDYSLSKDLGITRKEARKYIDDYLDRYPGVKQYMDNTVEHAKKYGFVTTVFNRRRYVPEVRSSNFNMRCFGERVSMNTPIQGSAADIIKVAMVKVHDEINKRNLKSKLVLQVHDELIIDTCREELDDMMDILKKCMENAVELKVPLITEIKSGDNWYETK